MLRHQVVPSLFFQGEESGHDQSHHHDDAAEEHAQEDATRKVAAEGFRFTDGRNDKRTEDEECCVTEHGHDQAEEGDIKSSTRCHVPLPFAKAATPPRIKPDITEPYKHVSGSRKNLSRFEWDSEIFLHACIRIAENDAHSVLANDRIQHSRTR